MVHDELCELCGVGREAKLRNAGHRTEMLSEIRASGYHKVGVFAELPGEYDFCYTVGLRHRLDHPELILLGLSVETGFSILDGIVELVKAGERFINLAESMDVLTASRVVFLDLAKTEYDEYLGQAENFYRNSDFPVLMVAWPDRNGVFPWDKDASDWLKLRQPALWTAAPE